MTGGPGSATERPNSAAGSARPARVHHLGWIGWGAVAVALAVVLYGGYGPHWSWTGINGGTATLWDWLHLLLLPVASVVLALWLRHRPAVGAPLKLAVAAAAAVFTVVVVAGYTVPWAWTGFTGNRLWDWLNLAVLPLAVVLIPVFVELRDRWGRRHRVLAAAAGTVFVVLVIAGYAVPWTWTGFTGNTLWDWLHLMLLPLLVPVVIIPLLQPMALSRMGVTSEEDGEEARQHHAGQDHAGQDRRAQTKPGLSAPAAGDRTEI